MWYPLDLNQTLGVTNVIIAGLAAWIVYRQHKLDRDRLRFELFEKRYSVYIGVKKHLSKILTEGRADYPDLWRYRSDIADRSFLFKEDVAEYLNQIDSHTLDLITSAKILEDLRVGPARTKEVERGSVHLKWLNDQLSESGKKFTPYLKFDHRL